MRSKTLPLWAAAVTAGSLITAGGAWAQSVTPSDALNYTRTSDFAYTANGLLLSETIEPGVPQLCVTTTYNYDAYGNKADSGSTKAVTTAHCGSTTGLAQIATRTSSVAFGAQTGRLGNGATGTTVPIPAGTFAASSANSLGHTESRVFDPRFGAVVQLTGPNGLATTWSIDDFGRKTLEVRADGTRTAFHHCLLSSVQVAGAPIDTSTNSSDCPTPSSGEVPAGAVRFENSVPQDSASHAIGSFTRVYYDAAGRQLRTVTEGFDGRLVVQDITYNGQGASIVSTQPYFLATGSSTATGTSADRGLTYTQYDALGRPTSVYVTDPTVQQPVAQVGGLAGVQTFPGYGSQQAARTTYTYSGLETTTTDDKGRTRKEKRSPEGKVIEVTDAYNARMVHQHDAFGNLLTTIDALGNRIDIGYDIRGRKLTLNDPDTGVTAYCYDVAGQLKAQQSSNQRGTHTPAACPTNTANGTVAPAVTGWTTFAYDQLGRLTNRIEPEYGTTFTYDSCTKGIGKLCQSSTTHGITRKVVYDGFGRAINARTDVSGGGPSMATAVAYDGTTGRLASQTYPTGVQVTFHYTTRGHLNFVKLGTQAVISPLPSTPGGTPVAGATLAVGTTLWSAVSVSAWGSAEQVALNNGVTQRAYFQPTTGRLTQLTAIGSAGTAADQRYGWNSVGELVTRVDAVGDNTGLQVADTLGYDSLGRLTSYTVAGGSGSVPATRTVTMAYNALGLLLAKSDVGNYTYPTQGTANGRPHAVQSVAGIGVSYGYDLNGNAVSASAGAWRSVSYTSFNLPDGSNGIQGPGGLPKATWQYDENHQRIREDRTNAAGTRTTWYLHPDNRGGLGFEREIAPGGAQSNRHYVSAGGTAFAVLVTTGALPTLQSTDTAPAVLASVAAVKLEYWHKDHLGSLVATTDHAGNVTARYAYDPFGKRRFTNSTYDAFGALVIDWTTTTNNGNDRGFTGHEHLDDLGLVHMNGRIFDPLIARFMQADPFVSNPLSLQAYDRYGYCGNSPMICTDPTGYSWLSRTWKKLWNNKVVRTVIIAVVAYYTAGYAVDAYAGAAGTAATSGYAASSVAAEAWAIEGGAIYSSAYAGAASSVTGGAIAGASGGFAAGFVGSNGDLKAAANGAIGGAISGGIAAYYGSSYSLERVAAETVGSGISAGLTGGDWRKSMQFQFGNSALTYLNWEMRQDQIQNSRKNPDNMTGTSKGFLGDGIKLAGARQEVAWDPIFGEYYASCASSAGGCQGARVGSQIWDPPNLLGIKYPPGGILDMIAESFAGPHDWLRNATGSYDALGNATHLAEAWARDWDSVKNYLLLVPASFFAVPGIVTSIGTSAPGAVAGALATRGH